MRLLRRIFRRISYRFMRKKVDEAVDKENPLEKNKAMAAGSDKESGKKKDAVDKTKQQKPGAPNIDKH